jgi:hypothetical protein
LFDFGNQFRCRLFQRFHERRDLISLRTKF